MSFIGGISTRKKRGPFPRLANIFVAIAVGFGAWPKGTQRRDWGLAGTGGLTANSPGERDRSAVFCSDSCAVASRSRLQSLDAAVYDNGRSVAPAVLKVAMAFGGSMSFCMGMKTAALSKSPVLGVYVHGAAVARRHTPNLQKIVIRDDKLR